jgi:hypothetical protein
MKKTIAELIDELSVTNIKIFFLIEKIQDGKGTIDEGQKVQLLNKQRSKVMNAISEEFKQEVRIKV